MEKLMTVLNSVIGVESARDIQNYLQTATDAEDVYEYLKDMIDISNPSHNIALLAYIDSIQSKATDEPCTAPDNNACVSQPEHSKQESKKQKKFVPLFKETGEARKTPLLPGRVQCNCLASKHSLISNCLNCGRVVCEQEGSGPCFFCQQLVCTREEKEILNRNSRKSEELLKKLMKKSMIKSTDVVLPSSTSQTSNNKGLKSALEHRNKLLEYDRTSARRTQVIDDEMDYFASDNAQIWLSPQEKAKLKKKEEELRKVRHASRREMKQHYTFDYAGRIVASREDERAAASHQLYSAAKDFDVSESRNNAKEDAENRTFVNPFVDGDMPKFVQNKSTHKNVVKPGSKKGQLIENNERRALRLQDDDLKQIVDDGYCLSMHQPWASLLVAGIKMHEGRSWYTPHRGRLWIASTIKTPTNEDIEELKSFYLKRGMQEDDFPTSYPTSSLLGCVDLMECLPQDTYTLKYPDGESESPYVFICENPQDLVVKFPISGRHKIYKLDKAIHEAAKKSITFSQKH